MDGQRQMETWLEQALQKSKTVRMDLSQVRKKVEDEQISSAECFEMLKGLFHEQAEELGLDHAQLLRGVVVEVGVLDSQEWFHFDLKTGPRVGFDVGRYPDKAEVTITYESEQTFRGLLSRRLDFMEAYRNGVVKVEGSLRAKMKLMPLMEYGKKLKNIHDQKQAREMLQVDIASEPVSGKFEGYLRKKSDWLKSWNERYFRLEWDSTNRPTLMYSISKNDVPRGTIELHSSYQVEARTTSEFALVDLRQGTKMVLSALDENDCKEWIRNLKAAISARARSRKSLSPLAKQDPSFMLPGSSNMDHDQMAKLEREYAKRMGSLQERLESLENGMVVAGSETNTEFVLRKLGWRMVPIGIAAGWLVSKIVDMGTTVLEGLISTISNSGLMSYCLGGSANPSNIRFCSVATISIGLTVFAFVVARARYFELFRRRWTVYGLAFRIVVDLKLTEMKTRELPPIHARAFWQTKQKTVSEEIYFRSLRLGGLWVKAAQHIGARPDAMPTPIINVLSRLQDEVPPTPFKQVRTVLEEELKCKVEEVFSSFEPEPIASASIGQVHVATLKEDGSKVVVKVQHPGVDKILRQDVHNMGVVMSWVAWLDSTMDLGPIMDHWRRHVINELDFQQELKTMTEVAENLKSDRTIYAALPRGVHKYSTRRMLVMRFVEGVKVTNEEGLRSVGIYGHKARGDLANDICNSFARQMFIDGLFNADPHPGNLLVARREDISQGQVVNVPVVENEQRSENAERPVPVLLDFGLALRMTDKIRIAFARLVYSGSVFDIGGIFRAKEELEIVLLREDIIDNLSELQFVFRDTKSPEESRKETMAHIEMAKKKWEENPSPPVSTFPPEFILFFRALFLLRGLCSSLEVRQPFIKTMARWSEKALREMHPDETERAAIQWTLQKPKLELERKLREKLDGLKKDDGDAWQAIQISVRDGTEGFDIAGGTLSPIDHRAVTTDSLFPIMSLIQGLSQVAIEEMLDEEKKQLKMSQLGNETRKSRFSMRASEKGGFTVEDIVCGDIKRLPMDPCVVPDKITTDKIRNWRNNFQSIQPYLVRFPRDDHPSRSLPWELSHFCFGWGSAMGWIAQQAQSIGSNSSDRSDCEPEISRWTRDELGSRLDGEIHMGFPGGINEAVEKDKAGRIVSLSIPFSKILKQQGIEDIGALLDEGAKSNLIQTNASDDLGGGLKIVSDTIPALKGREFWIDPRMLNYQGLQCACLPGTNALTTSSTLANFYQALGRRGKNQRGERILREPTVDAVFQYGASAANGPFAEDKLGIQRFTFLHGKTGETVEAYGQFGVGGSVGFTIPALDVSVSILVSLLSLERDTTEALLEIIYDHFDLKPKFT